MSGISRISDTHRFEFPEAQSANLVIRRRFVSAYSPKAGGAGSTETPAIRACWEKTGAAVFDAPCLSNTAWGNHEGRFAISILDISRLGIVLSWASLNWDEKSYIVDDSWPS